MLDLAIILIFVIYSISMGFCARKKASENLTEYFLAGRTLKGWKAGMSMAATQYAADTPLLVTGLIATAGLFSLWRLWIYALAFLMMGFILGAAWRRSGVLTDAEFTELRYSKSGALFLRGAKAIYMGTFINCCVLAMVLIAATRLAEPFLLWHEWLPSNLFFIFENFLQTLHFKISTLSETHPQVWTYSANNFLSILLIVAFTLLYSTTGGLRSVVATDVVQLIIAFIATFFYAFFVLDKIGGIDGIATKLSTLYSPESSKALLSFAPISWDEATFLFAGILAVQWFAQVNSDGTGYLAQRTMACQTDRDAKVAAITFTFAQVLIRSLLWLPIIVGLLIIYPATELPGLGTNSEDFRIAREGTFALGIRDLLPPGIRGLMLTGMLAALASTLDTHFNWGSSYWTNDIYKRIWCEKIKNRKANPQQLIWVARFSNVAIFVIALIMMRFLSSIQTTWHLSLLFGSGLGVVLILRWIWHRINLWSELTAILSSIILSPILLFGFPELSEGTRLLLMLALSTLFVLIATLCTPSESKKTLSQFYQKVQPAGFWSKVSQNQPESPEKRLLAAGIATLLCSSTLFLSLISLGKMVLGQATMASLLLGVLGVLVIPFWWKLAFQDKNS